MSHIQSLSRYTYNETSLVVDKTEAAPYLREHDVLPLPLFNISGEGGTCLPVPRDLRHCIGFKRWFKVAFRDANATVFHNQELTFRKRYEIVNRLQQTLANRDLFVAAKFRYTMR